MTHKAIGADCIASKIYDIPESPGIYKMLASDGCVLYVGKAKNLKKRLMSYTKKDATGKTAAMLSLVHDLDFVLTKSEVEALLFESNLIKKLQPKFNILLKDDKSFPYLKIKLDHKYPQIVKYRSNKANSKIYSTGTKAPIDKTRGNNKSKQSEDYIFGPFASTAYLDTTLHELNKIFKLRTCSDSYFSNRKRVCLQYQINRCSGPCAGKISQEDYNKNIKYIKSFLLGKTNQLQDDLTKEMRTLSEMCMFEEAAKVRDKIKAISYIQLKSSAYNLGAQDIDFIAIAKLLDSYAVEILLYRNNQICGNKVYFPENTHSALQEDVLRAFILQFYQNHFPPAKIITEFDLIDSDAIAKYIQQIHYTSSAEQIKIGRASNENQIDIIKNAKQNAEIVLKKRLSDNKKTDMMFDIIEEAFCQKMGRKDHKIDRIELYDNSHISGQFALGAMVVATRANGLEKKNYRTFNIKDSGGGDDYLMLKQVLRRRLKYLIDSSQRLNENMTQRPDLMIIDGGLGQLNTALAVLQEFKLDIPVAAMSKGPDRNAGQEIFHIQGGISFTFPKNSELMRYLQIIRDEVHNHAIKKHRSMRSKAIEHSKLDAINGIGKIRKTSLLLYFGSYENIKSASIEEISQVGKISKKLATQISNTLNGI